MNQPVTLRAARDQSLEEMRNDIRSLVRAYVAKAFEPSKFVAGDTVIPPSGKLLGSEEIEYMVDASLDGWLTSGRFNEQFEQELAKFIGISRVITVNSGSSANLVAFSTLTSPALGERAIRKGDEVITVAAGFPTTVNPIVQFGAIPVFIDIDISTHNVNTSLIESAITEKTKAIMLAHTLGNPFDIAEVKRICDKHGLWLVEDCCDALGASYGGKSVGTWGDIATLSFYPAHHITTGEGGAVFANSMELMKIAESFRDWGRDCYCQPGCDNTCGKRFSQTFSELPAGYDHKYVYSHLGYNLKITDMQAACGLAQIGKIDGFVAARRKNFSTLREMLEPLSEFVDFVEATPNSQPSWFGLPLTLKDNSGTSRVDLLRYLDQHKIGTRLLFAGNLTKQPSFAGVPYRVASDLTNTNRSMNQTFWLGVQPSLTETHLGYVADKMLEYFGLNF